MRKAERQSLVGIPVILGIAAAISWAGSQAGIQFRGIPLFALCGVLAFAINWLVFLPAYGFQTERYFDLTGSLTYASLVVAALALRDGPDPRALLVGGLVLVWAVRLGSFLFARIRRDGSDGRFDALKPSLPRFFMTWTLQGLWVLLTLSCGLAAMTSSRPVPLGGFAAAGALVWVAGFALEVLADQQKRRFRLDPSNEGRFIQSGVWTWSRHPNYFGEIVLWTGIAIIALPALSGWQYATLIAPVFVYVLLTRISGIPLLEARGKKKWGNEQAYQAYQERTPVLVPRPPRPV
jgi:steroid 5-alpha reductase family enzyme